MDVIGETLTNGDVLAYVRDASYILAAALFILGVKWLSSPVTARRGNSLAALGMLIVVVTTLISLEVLAWWAIAVGLTVGSAIGLALARYVKFTAMPQMVAAFNGFGGAASAIIAAAELFRHLQVGELLGGVSAATIIISTLIGAVTLTGSLVAFGKLQGIIPTQPVLFPLRNYANAFLLLSAVGLAVVAGIFTVSDPGPVAFWTFCGFAAIALILGITLILPIGGADMPVVVALLNSYSGLAAAATGFAIGNNILIMGGALVGASGLILTRIMTRAMNRSLANVMLGGVGATKSGKQGGGEQRSVRSITPEDAALVLGYARSVVLAPGYGLAVAQAQHAVRELADILKERGIQVRYAIHPVAGRMPGHMNVLLAEANVPYDELKDMEQINREFESTDVTLIIGANDVTNPAARTDPSSPIYGMPILNADKSKFVIVMKRSMASGFAGVENDLFHMDSTAMLFGDAKASAEALSKAIKEL